MRASTPPLPATRPPALCPQVFCPLTPGNISPFCTSNPAKCTPIYTVEGKEANISTGVGANLDVRMDENNSTAGDPWNTSMDCVAAYIYTAEGARHGAPRRTGARPVVRPPPCPGAPRRTGPEPRAAAVPRAAAGAVLAAVKRAWLAPGTPPSLQG